jgi:hypothetical protein
VSSDDGRHGGPERPDWIGLLGVAITAVLHLVLQSDGPNPAFIAGASLFWAGFVLVRALQDRGVFRRWGFRRDNLPEASRFPAALFAVVAIAFALYAAWRGSVRLPAHLPILLLLYPLWGWVQQLLVLGIVVRSLESVAGLRQRPVALVFVTAVVFGIIHAPDPRLVAATFLLELLIVPMYLRWRNLWPLGVLHGWLGALFYLWVLDRDLWAENFGG